MQYFIMSFTQLCCCLIGNEQGSRERYLPGAPPPSTDNELFAGLPERTRLQQLLKTHQQWCHRLLAAPSFFTVIDSYPIELLFPIREGRSPQQVGKKGKDQGRWTVGIKQCWLLNNQGQVVDWDWAMLDTHDQAFHPIIERYNGQTIVLSDFGFRCRDGIPANLKLCPKGTWNERMSVEIALSMVTVVCDLKRLRLLQCSTCCRHSFITCILMLMRPR